MHKFQTSFVCYIFNLSPTKNYIFISTQLISYMCLIKDIYIIIIFYQYFNPQEIELNYFIIKVPSFQKGKIYFSLIRVFDLQMGCHKMCLKSFVGKLDRSNYLDADACPPMNVINLMEYFQTLLSFLQTGTCMHAPRHGLSLLHKNTIVSFNDAF